MNLGQPETTAQDCQRYFAEFLQEKINLPLLPNLSRLSAVFSIHLTAPLEKAWTLEIREGALVSIAPGTQGAACGFVLNPQTFLEIAAGRLGPQMAFFQRRVELSGRIDLGLKLATVLADFFTRFPYRVAHA